MLSCHLAQRHGDPLLLAWIEIDAGVRFMYMRLCRRSNGCSRVSTATHITLQKSKAHRFYKKGNTLETLGKAVKP